MHVYREFKAPYWPTANSKQPSEPVCNVVTLLIKLLRIASDVFQSANQRHSQLVVPFYTQLRVLFYSFYNMMECICRNRYFPLAILQEFSKRTKDDEKYLGTDEPRGVLNLVPKVPKRCYWLLTKVISRYGFHKSFAF